MKKPKHSQVVEKIEGISVDPSLAQQLKIESGTDITQEQILEIVKLSKQNKLSKQLAAYIEAFADSSYSVGSKRYKAHKPLSILYIERHAGSAQTVCLLDENNCYRSTAVQGSVPSSSHSHDYYELTFILDGQMDIYIEDTLHHYQKGDACIINSRVRHHEDMHGSYTVAFIGLHGDFIAQYSEKHPLVSRRSRIHRFFTDSTDEHDTARAYLDFIRSPASQGEGAAYDSVVSLLQALVDHRAGMHYEVMAHVSRLLDELQQSEYTTEFIKLSNSKEQLLVEQAVHYIEARKAKVTRSELSAALHYNGDYLDQLFRKYNDSSIHEFSVNVCILEAQRLLQTTHLSVGQIIGQLGYENRSNFYAQFQKKTGMTPAQFRRKFQQFPRTP